jgi:(2Fe-2S) ferredoxin
VFFCVNQRDAPEACCGCHNAEAMRQHAKSRVKKLGIKGEGGVRVNSAGCLDRCQEGPCVVVYPEGIWYTYVDEKDIDEIIDEHLVNGRIVDRLRI